LKERCGKLDDTNQQVGIFVRCNCEQNVFHACLDEDRTSD